MMGSMQGLAFGWHLHVIFGFTALVGAVLFIIWASKLKAEKLKTWVLWALVIGILGTLLTGSWGMMGWQNMMGDWNDRMGQMGPGMMQNR